MVSPRRIIRLALQPINSPATRDCNFAAPTSVVANLGYMELQQSLDEVFVSPYSETFFDLKVKTILIWRFFLTNFEQPSIIHLNGLRTWSDTTCRYFVDPFTRATI